MATKKHVQMQRRIEKLQTKLDDGTYDPQAIITELKSLFETCDDILEDTQTSVEEGNKDWLSIYSVVLHTATVNMQLTKTALARIDHFEKGTAIPDLKNDLEEVRTQLSQSENKVISLEKRVSTLQKQIADLKQEREKGKKETEKNSNLLQVGQLPFEIEKLIIKIVLEKHTIGTKYLDVHYLHEMEEALDHNGE